MRDINQAGLLLIKKQENDDDPKSGFVLINGQKFYKPYIDEVGVCTIGFGTISYPNGKKVTMSDPVIDEATALSLLQWELRAKSTTIDNWAQHNNLVFNDNQFSALCSLAYNLGAGVITDNGRSMHDALLTKNADQIKAAFMLYVKGYKVVFGVRIGKTLPGLVTRRQLEINLYFS